MIIIQALVVLNVHDEGVEKQNSLYYNPQTKKQEIAGE